MCVSVLTLDWTQAFYLLCHYDDLWLDTWNWFKHELPYFHCSIECNMDIWRLPINKKQNITNAVSSLQVVQVHEQISALLPRRLAAKPLIDLTALPPSEGPLPWPNSPSSPLTPAHPLPHPLRWKGKERDERGRRRGQISPVSPTTQLQDPDLEHPQLQAGDRRLRVGGSVVVRAH